MNPFFLMCSAWVVNPGWLSVDTVALYLVNALMRMQVLSAQVNIPLHTHRHTHTHTHTHIVKTGSDVTISDILPQVPVQMVTFVSLIKYHPQVAEWRCASVEYGEQCAMTCGMKEMLQLHADSWDLVAKVQKNYTNK